METDTYTIDRTDAPNIKFAGVRLGIVSSRDPYNDGGRWTDYALFRTKSGKYIAAIVHVTCWQGESDQCTARICDTVQDAINFLGHSDSAKELYAIAGIEDIETVD